MEQKPICQEKFDAIEAHLTHIDNRLASGDRTINRHNTDIAVLQNNVNSLIKTMSGLTKALWGVCGTTVATLVGFLLWYIKSL